MNNTPVITNLFHTQLVLSAGPSHTHIGLNAYSLDLDSTLIRVQVASTSRLFYLSR